MSKTIKTRPFWVRQSDDQDKGVKVKEVHNHINRDCDLPEKTPKGILEQNHYGCHYEFVYNGHNVCGCKMCTAQFERKQENRANRLVRKRTLSRVLKDSSYEEEAIYDKGKVW